MRRKRLLSLICAALLAFSAAGCSSENPADTEAVMAALEKFAGCSSFTTYQVTECRETMKIDGEETVYNSRSEAELSLISKPVPQMKNSTVTKVEGEGEAYEQRSTSYIVPENGGYTEYVTDGAEWYKVTVDDASALAGIDAKSIISTFCVDMLSYKKAGEESLDSGKAIRYDGRLADEKLVVMLLNYGYLNSISTMSDNQQGKIIENLVKDLDYVPVSVWVDVASGYPVRFELRMVDTMEEIEKSINKTLGNKASDSQYYISDCIVSMIVRDFDAVSEIVLPAEAASATPYEIAE